MVADKSPKNSRPQKHFNESNGKPKSAKLIKKKDIRESSQEEVAEKIRDVVEISRVVLAEETWQKKSKPEKDKVGARLGVCILSYLINFT